MIEKSTALSCVLLCLLALETTMVEMKELDNVEDEQTGAEPDEIDELAKDEPSVDPQFKCAFECSIGAPIQNPDHKPGYNGCGSYGVSVDFKKCPYLTSCCNQHDLCYDLCGTSRDICDNIFKRCTQTPTGVATLSSDSKGLCKAVGLGMYYTVRLAGCPAFKNAQKKSCICK